MLQGILENLPALYSLNVPRLNLLSSPEVRQPGKAPNYSVNWAKGFTAPEVVDAMKGKEQVSDFKTTFFLCEIKNFLILIFNNVYYNYNFKIVIQKGAKIIFEIKITLFSEKYDFEWIFLLFLRFEIKKKLN